MQGSKKMIKNLLILLFLFSNISGALAENPSKARYSAGQVSMTDDRFENFTGSISGGASVTLSLEYGMNQFDLYASGTTIVMYIERFNYSNGNIINNSWQKVRSVPGGKAFSWNLEVPQNSRVNLRAVASSTYDLFTSTRLNYMNGWTESGWVK